MTTVIVSGSQRRGRRKAPRPAETENRASLYAVLILGAAVGLPLLGMIYFFEWAAGHPWILENLLVVPIAYVAVSLMLLWLNFVGAKPSKSGVPNFLSPGGIFVALLYIGLTLFWGTPLVTMTSWDTAHEAGVFDGNDPFKLGWNLDQYADQVPPEFRNKP